MNDMGLVVVGAAGRMGQTLIRLIQETPGARLAGAIERAGSPALGKDAGELAGVGPLGVAIVDDPLPAFAKADGVLDFSVPAATVQFAGYAAQARIVHVIGTTGLGERHHMLIDLAAGRIAVLQTGNTSLGVTLLAHLVRQAAARLGDDWDIEIAETHHRMKVDAPSGTALRMGEVVADALGRDLKSCAVYGREGVTGERDGQTIGFATVRGGDIVGDHTVLFAGIGERIEITHKSASRMPYATGSLRAAKFLAGRKSGLFDMQDVLGLK